MNFSREQIVWQEVPGETSLAFTISGCPLRCPGCHSADTWPVMAGKKLTPDYLWQRMQQYRGLITCVLFMGGEWFEDELLNLLSQVRSEGLKTCLYTGLDALPDQLRNQLTYLKTGSWQREVGGLNSSLTNQRFIEVRTNTCLNHKFHF